MPEPPARGPKRANPAPPSRPPASSPPQPLPPAPARPAPGRPRPAAPTTVRPAAGPPPPNQAVAAPSVPPVLPAQSGSGDIGLGVAISADPGSGTVTARKAGGLRDLALDVDPDVVGLRGALQHLAKAINIAFQSDFGENHLESVYQAAVVRGGGITIIHREYFGYHDTWFGNFGRLLRSMSLSLEGPDPASPEGQRRIMERGPSSIRGLFNLIGRKLDLVAEFENRVPAFVEQMLDRLEATGMIVGWDRDDWEVSTTTIGLDVRITPRAKPAA